MEERKAQAELKHGHTWRRNGDEPQKQATQCRGQAGGRRGPQGAAGVTTLFTGMSTETSHRWGLPESLGKESPG